MKYIYFDLFYTLVVPKYNENDINEYDVLGMEREEWEYYAEDKELYYNRAIGLEKDQIKIIRDIITKMDKKVSNNEIIKILELRKNRFKRALMDVDPGILDTIKALKGNGNKLSIISNADPIDIEYWHLSPLKRYFATTLFSCEVGYMKPDIKMYQLAIDRMNANINNSLFVSDGDLKELLAAKKIGMITIKANYFIEQNNCLNNIIMQSADYCIDSFKDILVICGKI